MVGTVPTCRSCVSAAWAGMAPGYVFKKREMVRPKLVWSLAVYGCGTPGCQTPNEIERVLPHLTINLSCLDWYKWYLYKEPNQTQRTNVLMRGSLINEYDFIFIYRLEINNVLGNCVLGMIFIPRWDVSARITNAHVALLLFPHAEPSIDAAHFL